MLACATLAASSAMGYERLDVQLDGLTRDGRLPLSSAFCLPPGSTALPTDRSPRIRWSAGPAGTASYVLMMVDPDVPKDLSLINKPGIVITADTPRMDIYHWILVDIPASIHALDAGAEGDGFVPGGKPIGQTPIGLRGTNDYWPLFNRPGAAPDRKGPYGGYDGPCPPMNDQKVHDYRFVVYALDLAKLPLQGQFFAPDVLRAMQGHVLATRSASAAASAGAAPQKTSPPIS